jgi:NO-binding membrane sensor protein with MHYT domain
MFELYQKYTLFCGILLIGIGIWTNSFEAMLSASLIQILDLVFRLVAEKEGNA